MTRCSASPRGGSCQDRDRRRVTPEHWFKPAAAMRALFADLPEACDNTLAIARRCAVMAEARKPLLPVCPKVRAGATEEETLRAMAIEGLARRMDGRRRRRGDRAPLSRAARLRVVGHRRHGFSGLLPDRRRLHPMGEGAGHSRRARSRLRCRLGRRVVADHHRPRSAPLRPAVRAFPQSASASRCRTSTSTSARKAATRHRLCPRGIRQRPRGADHHLRQAAGPRGGARRRPRSGPAIRPGEQGRRADPQQSGQAGHAPAGGRWRAAPAGDARRRRSRAAPAGDRPAARRPVSPRQHPRRRHRHRRPAADRTGAALPRSQVRIPRHAVLDEIRRAGRAGEVRLPGTHHADDPQACHRFPEGPRCRGRPRSPAAG